MPELANGLREYFETIAPPIDAEAVMDRQVVLPAERPIVTSRWVMAVAAAVVVIAVIGAAALLSTTTGQGSDPASPSPTLITTTTLSTGGEVEPGPLTSFEDIAGIYELQGLKYFAGYLHFFEDGTLHASSNRDLVEERPSDILETRFELTKVFIKAIKGACIDEDPDAIYDIQLL